MKMSVLEKSECFRAFLILIGTDRVISPQEKALLLQIGKRLDFDGGFCEASVDDLLENKHIPDEPPLFSQKEFAEDCLRDCLRLAAADCEIRPEERHWIMRIAQKNGLPPAWVDDAIERLRQHDESAADGTLAIQKYL